ncbi:MAG TPA: hypothetical protein VFY17_06050 [Pilimelia sp.]|nr:hypothetical protein [Pilimelia sp.]
MGARETITVAQLRHACDRILDAVARRYGPALDVGELGGGHYWTLDAAAAYNLLAEPTASITLGDSRDDAEELVALADPDRPVVLWHDAAHLAGLLRYLADRDLPGAPTGQADTPADG